MGFLKRFQLESRDRIRFSKPLRKCLSHLAGWQARNGDDPQQIARSIVLLCRAARLASTEQRMCSIERQIRERIAALKNRPVDWSQFVGQMKRNRIEAGIILKPYLSPRERGVVLISFEYQWARLTQLSDLKEFAARYKLVLAPSWSPPHSLETTLF